MHFIFYFLPIYEHSQKEDCKILFLDMQFNHGRQSIKFLGALITVSLVLIAGVFYFSIYIKIEVKEIQRLAF